MFKQHKWIRGVMLGLTVVFGMSTLSVAQGTWGWGWSNHSWSGRHVPREYRLTKEQTKEMNRIRHDYQERMRPLEQQFEAKRIELDAAWARSDADPAQIAQLRAQVGDLESQIEGMHYEANVAGARCFSPEQRDYYGDAYDVFGHSGMPCQWDRAYSGSGVTCGWGGDGRHASHHDNRTSSSCCW